LFIISQIFPCSDINYSTPIPGKTDELKKILHGIGGTAIPGEMLAVLGTSGAGKPIHHDV